MIFEILGQECYGKLRLVVIDLGEAFSQDIAYLLMAAQVFDGFTHSN
jgi:hypothetical protein